MEDSCSSKPTVDINVTSSTQQTSQAPRSTTPNTPSGRNVSPVPPTFIPSAPRRTSIYGTGEDRIILDIGSLYIKAGFSGESRPRHIVPVYAGNMKVHLDPEFNGSGGVVKACGESCRVVGEFAELFDLEIGKHPDGLEALYDRLAHYLREIYFRYLLTDPKQRKVVLCESPMLPLKLKQLIAKVLFENLQVPSISFAPSHMLALLTTGCTTGLVIDVGHLETTVLPTLSARPLTPYIRTTPLAGRALTKRLKDLLSAFGSMIIPPSTKEEPVHAKYLTHSVLEDIKTRFLFVSPMTVSPASFGGITEKTLIEDMEKNYASVNSAHNISYPITISKNGRERKIGTLIVPGWIREHCAEVLFEGDEDESSVVGCTLECLLKAPIHLRRPLAKAILLIGGTTLLPNFQLRFGQELIRALNTDRRFKSLNGLADIEFLENNGSGKVFVANCRAWVGGSLIGSLKSTVVEISKDKYTGQVPDWTTANLSKCDE